jgi:hypothetical protein
MAESTENKGTRDYAANRMIGIRATCKRDAELGNEESDVAFVLAKLDAAEKAQSVDAGATPLPRSQGESAHSLSSRLVGSLPQERDETVQLSLPTPWYVEDLRPGREDEARVYDARHFGVFKPTCNNPAARRPLAEWLCRLVNAGASSRPPSPQAREEEKDALTRTGELGVQPSPQPASASEKG